MKFSKVAVLLVCMSAAVMVSAETVKGSKDRKNENRNLKKDKKMEGSVGSTCERKLPGYIFFGEAYEQRTKRERGNQAFESFVEDYTFAEYEVFEEASDFGGSFCADNKDTFEVCKLIAVASAKIYADDTKKCLLTSFEKSARELTCSHGGRKKRRGSDMMIFSKFTTGASDVMSLLDIDQTTIVAEFKPQAKMLTRTAQDPDKMFDDAEKILDGADEVFEFIVQALGTPAALAGVASNGFFYSCMEETKDFPFCVLIFTLYKTLDATICDYQESCTIEESCTADLKFQTESKKRSITMSLPEYLSGPDDFLANLLAPCLPTYENSKDGKDGEQCAAFCDYVDGYHECDVGYATGELLYFGGSAARPNSAAVMKTMSK